MLNVHLYFVKHFGCLILEGNLPIDIASFSDAIMEEKAHPYLYLAFGSSPEPPMKTVGRSDVEIANLDGRSAFASCFYYVADLTVNIMYSIPGENRQGLRQSWHPKAGYKRLVMVDFLPKDSH